MLKPVLAGFTGRKALADTETYPNYILLKFEDVETGVNHTFRIDPDNGLDDRKAAEVYCRSLSVCVTYNGHGFDDHVFALAFRGLDCHSLWEAADQIIAGNGRRHSPLLGRNGEPLADYPLSIDLARILTGAGGFPGLKTLGPWFGYKTLQELPIEPGTTLTEEQKATIDAYNIHDINLTRLVLERLDKGIEMRRVMSEKYGINLTSDSNARLSERVVVTHYERLMQERVNATWNPEDDEPPAYRLKAPKKTEWLCGGIDLLSRRHTFTDPRLQNLLATVSGWNMKWRRITNTKGEPDFETPAFSTKLTLATKTYSVGMGGLHSEDAPLIYRRSDDEVVIDIDVSSCYAAVIINEKIVPDHIDADLFVQAFREIRDRRLEAKRAGEEEIAAGLKEGINGTYGKYASRFKSDLVDPPKRAAVSLNGQFILLRLIQDMLTINGLAVLSANTDGIMVRLPRQHLAMMQHVMGDVAATYAIEFEQVEVLKLFRTDISNFVMEYQTPAGKTGVKRRGGIYHGVEWGKKNAHAIVADAAVRELLHGIPVAETINGCDDLARFTDYQAVDKTHYVEDSEGNRLSQRINRWYEAIPSTAGVVLYSVNAANPKQRARHAGMVNAVLVNDLPDAIPADLNRAHYIEAAQKIVDSALYPKPKRPGRNKKFENLNDQEREELHQRQTAGQPNLENLATLDLKYYRDYYLAKTKNLNYYDSMRAVLAMLWHRYRLTKADLIWCYESFDSSIQWWTRKGKVRDILSYIDWLVQQVPVEKEVLPDDDMPCHVTVEIMDDEPGAGKTREALREIVQGGPGVYWWAIGKINPLASERCEELATIVSQNTGSTVDFLAIHCEAGGKGTMKMQIDRRMAEISQRPDRDAVIFVTLITHKTLVDHCLDRCEGTLMIDEPIQIWEQRSSDFNKSYRVVRELLHPVGISEPDAYDGKVDVDTQAVRLVLTQEGCEQFEDDDMKRDTLHGSTNLRWIIEQSGKTSGQVFAFADEWNALGEPDQGNLDVLALLHPCHIAHFDRVVMMAAYFDQLLIHQLWSYLYDVTWVKRPLSDGWARTAPLSERVTLYYLLENREISDTYLMNRGNPSRRRAMAQALKAFFGDQPFIWSINESLRATGDFAALPTHIIDEQGHQRDAYLTPRANGINCYSGVHGAAWLGTIKLPSAILRFLERILGRQRANLLALQEYELYACLQFLSRINTRRFVSADQCKYVVADKTQAEYVKIKCGLGEDRVLPLPMDAALKAQLDDVAGKGRGRKASQSEKEKWEAQCRKREADRQRAVHKRAEAANAKGRKPGASGRPERSEKEKLVAVVRKRESDRHRLAQKRAAFAKAA